MKAWQYAVFCHVRDDSSSLPHDRDDSSLPRVRDDSSLPHARDGSSLPHDRDGSSLPHGRDDSSIYGLPLLKLLYGPVSTVEPDLNELVLSVAGLHRLSNAVRGLISF